MKSFAYTLICLFTFSIFGFGQTTTLTLEPTDDVYRHNGGPKNEDIVQLKYGKQHAWFKFDLSSINGDILSASLVLTSTTESFRGEIGVYEGDRTDWEEETVNNNSSNHPKRKSDTPLGTFKNEEHYQPDQSYQIDLHNLWTSEEAVTLMVYRLDGGGRYTNGNVISSFASKEYDNANYHPQLILEINGTVDDGGDDDDPTDDGDDDGNNDDDDNGGDGGSGDDNDDNGGDGDDNDDGNNNTGESVWDIKEDGTVYYNGGNVGIGTDNPITKFVVDGEIRATKVRVRGDVNLPDYVFEEDYNLRSLEEVETYINQNGHLPEVPSAAQVEKEGLSLGDMDATLLKKVEELTLYLIEMKKQNEELKKEVEALKKQLKP